MKNCLYVFITVIIIFSIAITVFSAPPVMEETPIVTMKKGDCNGNGRLDSYDARKVYRISTGKIIFPEGTQKLLDMDNDGEITLNDAKNILKISAKLIADNQ